MASKQLAGTKTHTNLKDAFAGESQANTARYLYFAKVADVEGRPDVAGLFKDCTADGETGHRPRAPRLPQAGGRSGDRDARIGNTEKNLKSAVAGETHEYETMYPGMAKEARAEGFDDIAEWFETLAKAEKSPRRPLQEGARIARLLIRPTAPPLAGLRPSPVRVPAGRGGGERGAGTPGDQGDPSRERHPESPDGAAGPEPPRPAATTTRATSRASCGAPSRSVTSAACA